MAKHLTRQEISELIELAPTHSYKELAKRFDKHYSTIARVLKNHEKVATQYRATLWTAEDDEILKANNHLTEGQLAKLLGRTKVAIASRRMTLIKRGMLEHKTKPYKLHKRESNTDARFKLSQ
jgi:transposase